jgi:hypothetical protein
VSEYTRLLEDYYFYSRNFHKIKTKIDGLQILRLRQYQKKFIDFWQLIEGPVRIIALKPRQAGFTTIVASKFSQEIGTRSHHAGIAMADKGGRTQAIRKIYTTFLQELPSAIVPMISKNNTEEIYFDNPNPKLAKNYPGLGSGVLFETANDENAGRSSSRKFAHLSENAFYRYYKEIDEGVQNSIPLAPGTAIIKESTANGMAGIGSGFFDLYNAAKAGESIYKNFFVAWYEIDDYMLKVPRKFEATKYEIDIMKKFNITKEQLCWRRAKLSEYLSDGDDSFLTPAERFKQDFPLDDIEAFRSTGQPVFDPELITRLVHNLKQSTPNQVTHNIRYKSYIIQEYIDRLKIYTLPRENKEYYIGGDVAEGLAQGDASSLMIIDNEYREVASWHGKIDPDIFGHLLIALGTMFNDAFICCENNNMGHTTITTIKNEGYGKQYKKVTEDKKTKEKSTKYGWTTTGPSKGDMLNEGIARLRDGDIKILTMALLLQMTQVTRGDNGVVDLNGRDRVVAYCLACMARKHYKPTIHVPKKKVDGVFGTGADVHNEWVRKNKKSSDPF